jgi:signal transduction histidine kinase
MKRMVEEDSIGSREINQFNQYLTLMETETRRTSRIVSNLLAFSRQSKIELKRISLNRMIEQILFLNSNLLKIAGVKVSTDLDPNLPDLVGSEDQLQQVFMSWRSILKTAGSAYRRKIYQSFLNPFLPPKKKVKVWGWVFR